MRLAKYAICGLASTLLAMSHASAQTTYERAVKGETVRVAIFSQSPWGIRDQNGNYRGYSVDVIREAFSRMAITKFELVVSEFGALIPSLQSKRADVITAGLYVNKDRCRLVAFGDPDIRIGDAALVRKGNPKNIHSYEDIAKNGTVKVAVGRGSAVAADVQAAGVPADRVLPVQDNQAAASALLAGRADVVPATSGSIAALFDGMKGQDVERASPFIGLKNPDGSPKMNIAAVAFRTDDLDFRDAYNKTLETMKADGFLRKLLVEYGFGEAEFPNEKSSSVCG